MPVRRPRLPMVLGLAALTAAAHALAALAHLAGGHAPRDWPLLVLLALAPIAGVTLALRGRPRHGAIGVVARRQRRREGVIRRSAGLVLAATMLAAASWTLYSHFWLDTDLADPALYAWIVQLMLAFEIQGAALGLLLIFKPEAALLSDPPAALP